MYEMTIQSIDDTFLIVFLPSMLGVLIGIIIAEILFKFTRKKEEIES